MRTTLIPRQLPAFRQRLSALRRRWTAPPTLDEDALRLAWAANPLATAPDTFVLTRIIGNDLEPRHRQGQSRDNLRFILENEPDLAACEKRWVVNRIAEPEEEARILDLLAARGQPVLRLPFDVADYARAGWDTACLHGNTAPLTGAKPLGEAERERLDLALYRRKNAYAMNNNGARNAALADGRSRAKWILPWDGNSFLTAAAWQALREAVAARPWLPYFLVPMARVPDNAAILDPDFAPDSVEEPQILMRTDAAESFDEAFVYGRRPKVELFWRLGVPGDWDRWRDDPWDPPRRPRAREAGRVGTAGWVARLGSGRDALEREDRASFLDRGTARRAGIRATLDRLDARLPPADPDPAGLTCYSSAALAALRAGDTPLRGAILADAEAALTRGPHSVTHKTTLAPSGDPHDYWHPAPYWWPNPYIPGGRPYIRRDGKRVPGTRMYEPESDRYDRTRLQFVFDDTTALALAHALTGRADLASHAAGLIDAWFVDPATRMTPHLRYAQVRRGWNRNEGVGAGIIEFKDLYYFLDAVRLLEAAGVLPSPTRDGLATWLTAYLHWLGTSRQGRRERAAENNHGTYYDLQVAAIAAWLGDRTTLREALVRAQARLPAQITPGGLQPEEMRRTTTAHYCFFNLQAWLALLRIGRRTGLLHPDPATDPWDRLACAIDWTLAQDATAWPHRQIGRFDPERALPLAAHAAEAGFATTPPAAGKPRFDPHDGIPPYWALTAAGTEA